MASILMVVDTAPPQYGGAGQQALFLADEMTARGHSIDLIARRKENVKPTHPDVRFVGPYVRSEFLSNVFFALIVFRIILFANVDVVHCHGGFYYGFTSALASKMRRIPMILKVTLVGADDPLSVYEQRKFGFRIGRILVKQFDWAYAVIALNPEIKSICHRYSESLNVIEIPNGIKIDAFRRAARIEFEEHFSTLKPVVIFTGDVCVRKGADVLVRSWSSFIKEYPDGILHLVGPIRDDVRKVLGEIPDSTRSKIKVHGLLTQKETIELLGESTVFVLPSHQEGLPNSLIEALGQGLSCVASSIDVNRAVCLDAATYCNPESSESVSSALKIATERYLEMSRRALVRSNDFDISAIANQYSELYDAIFTSNGASGRNSEEFLE